MIAKKAFGVADVSRIKITYVNLFLMSLLMLSSINSVFANEKSNTKVVSSQNEITQDSSKRPDPFNLSLAYIDTIQQSENSNDLSHEYQSYAMNFSADIPLLNNWYLGSAIGFAKHNYQWIQNHHNASSLLDENWSDIRKYSTSLSFIYRPNAKWLMIISPKIQTVYGGKASFSDGMGYGAVVNLMHHFTRGKTLGIGAAYLNEKYNVRMMPFVVINWQITDKLLIRNPFEIGFSGPAGLELQYQLSPNWNIGIGSSKRSKYFALQQNKYMKVENWVGFVRAGWQMTKALKVNAYGGYFYKGTLESNFSSNKLDIDDHAGIALAINYQF